MILIVGLGNPGKKLQKTRHNLGFRVVNSFKKKNEFSNWKRKKNFKALISEGKVCRKKIILIKPQTFMNDSGESIKLLIVYYKLSTESIWVVHDDLDILLGKIKISKRRGSAGHKGVQSIIDKIKTKNFVRFRVGIQPEEKNKMDNDNFVLQRFSQEEEKILKKVIREACQTLETAIKKGI